MPLYVGDIKIGQNYRSSTEFLEKFPELKTKSQEFASQPYKETFTDDNAVYIGQCEYITVHPSDISISVIGSDRATTCQIVVLKDLISGAHSLTHFDGTSIQQGLEDMIKSLEELSDSNDQQKYELYIIGGFLDNRGISEKIFLEIIKGATQLPVDVLLVCSCVCALNDKLVNGLHVPRIYGLGVFISSGKMFPVQQFQCPVPDEMLRHVAIYQGKNVRQIYTSRTQELKVQPFQLIFPAHEARQRAALSDEVILQAFSTSPHCEPANFVSKLRQVHLFLAENPNILEKYFPHKRPRIFKRQNNGEWCLIDEG